MKLTTKQLRTVIQEELTNKYRSQNHTNEIIDIVTTTIQRVISSPATLESIQYDLLELQGKQIDKSQVLNDVTLAVTEKLRGTIYKLVSDIVREL